MAPPNDTIVAIATPMGEGGISVIRVSGPAAIEVVGKGFRGKYSLSAVATHTAHFGTYVNGIAKVIDEVVVTVFKEPQSYTGEDVVEISCHGGGFVTKTILAEIISKGARLAAPGEYTKRAFLNGKIDLLQAEAVADLIQARSEAAHHCSVMQLQGRLSNEIGILRQKLTELLSLTELELDFAEEDLKFTSKGEALGLIAEVENNINKMLQSYTAGKIYKEGIRVVFAGRPNVGKSSVMNRLLNANRAIVTDIPGTTRDTIEESINIGGIIYTLVDTAGLRESNDVIEREGIIRSEEELKKADIILFILDLTAEDIELDKSIFLSLLEFGHPIVLVGNKCDMANSGEPNFIHKVFDSKDCAILSAKTGDGFETLRTTLSSVAEEDIESFSDKSVIVNNLRHLHCLNSALLDLQSARGTLNLSLSAEFVSIDLHKAIRDLGEIIGEVTSEDILNEIFSRFCIGK